MDPNPAERSAWSVALKAAVSLSIGDMTGTYVPVVTTERPVQLWTEPDANELVATFVDNFLRNPALSVERLQECRPRLALAVFDAMQRDPATGQIADDDYLAEFFDKANNNIDEEEIWVPVPKGANLGSLLGVEDDPIQVMTDAATLLTLHTNGRLTYSPLITQSGRVFRTDDEIRSALLEGMRKSGPRELLGLFESAVSLAETVTDAVLFDPKLLDMIPLTVDGLELLEASLTVFQEQMGDVADRELDQAVPENYETPIPPEVSEAPEPQTRTEIPKNIQDSLDGLNFDGI